MSVKGSCPAAEVSHEEPVILVILLFFSLQLPLAVKPCIGALPQVPAVRQVPSHSISDSQSVRMAALALVMFTVLLLGVVEQVTFQKLIEIVHESLL